MYLNYLGPVSGFSPSWIHSSCTVGGGGSGWWHGGHNILCLLNWQVKFFVHMYGIAHLTSHFIMSDSSWVTTPSWLSRSLRIFCIVLLCVSYHLFLISFASVRSLLFLSFIMIIHVWNVPLVSLISLKKSLVFPILLFSSISLHCSLKKDFLSLLAILWNSAFSWVYPSLSPLPFVFVKPPQTNTLPSYISFSLGWFWSLPSVQCYEPPSIVPQALCLPDLIPWIYSSPSLYNYKVFDLGHTWMA